MKKQLVMMLLATNMMLAQKNIITDNGSKIEIESYKLNKSKIYYYQLTDTVTERKLKLKDVLVIEDNDTTITQNDLFEKNNNFTLGLGVGSSFGGVGLQFQWHNNKPFHTATHIGLGKTPDTFIFNVGYKIYPYKFIYIDLDVGSKGWESNEIPEGYYGVSESKALFGTSIMAGIDITGKKKNSVGFNLGIGYTKHFNSDITPSALAVSAGVLFRFSKWKY